MKPQLAPPLNMPINCASPTMLPTERGGTGQYETGKDSFNTPKLPTVLWEPTESAVIAKQPCWLTFLNVIVNPAITTVVYALLFDLNINDPQQLADLMSGNVGARYTLGPVPASTGGTIVFAPVSEQIGKDGSVIEGLPFNFGLVLLASTTPRFHTSPENDAIAISARVKL